VPLARPATDPLVERLGDGRLAAQVRAVVAAVKSTGHPPAGVAQGGRRGSQRGVFLNAERRLPGRPPGYYHESDVWPRQRGGRGAERLIFGREGEVFYSPDHYRTFIRIE
jgi:ribonuclease